MATTISPKIFARDGLVACDNFRLAGCARTSPADHALKLAFLILVASLVMLHPIFVVSSESMYPCCPKNSLIIAYKTPISQLQNGDIIVFESDALGGKPAVHRIVKLGADGVVTKGDNNPLPDNQLITSQTYIARAVLVISPIAQLAILLFGILFFILFL